VVAVGGAAAEVARAAGVVAVGGAALLPPEVQPASMPSPTSADAVSVTALARAWLEAFMMT
jgi:hypothetical protein